MQSLPKTTRAVLPLKLIVWTVAASALATPAAGYEVSTLGQPAHLVAQSVNKKPPAAPAKKSATRKRQPASAPTQGATPTAPSAGQPAAQDPGVVSQPKYYSPPQSSTIVQPPTNLHVL